VSDPPVSCPARTIRWTADRITAECALHAGALPPGVRPARCAASPAVVNPATGRRPSGRRCQAALVAAARSAVAGATAGQAVDRPSRGAKAVNAAASLFRAVRYSSAHAARSG